MMLRRVSDDAVLEASVFLRLPYLHRSVFAVKNVGSLVNVVPNLQVFSVWVCSRPEDTQNVLMALI